jgi:hypothetical protein
VVRPTGAGLYWMIDGKPLPIGGCSRDRQAGYGGAAGGKAKGYKVHAALGADGAVAAWRLAPMTKDERVMAARLLRSRPHPRLGEGLLRQRAEFEGQFGGLTNWGGGLRCLPPWVRTHRRVHRWVQAKLVLTALKQRLPERTCAA